MRIVLTLGILGSLVAQPVSVTADQEAHAHADRRGAAVMGFEQDRTVHHFLLFKGRQ